jgi:hypothetical protein
MKQRGHRSEQPEKAIFDNGLITKPASVYIYGGWLLGVIT